MLLLWNDPNTYKERKDILSRVYILKYRFEISVLGFSFPRKRANFWVSGLFRQGHKDFTATELLRRV